MVRWHLTSFAVLTLNTLQLAGQQWWPITTHIFMVPSLTLPSYSRANQKLSRLPFLLSPEIRTISTQPLQPTLTGDCQVCHTLMLHCWIRSWYLVAFLSEASVHSSFHGTICSIRMIFFASLDHINMPGLRKFEWHGENAAFLPGPLTSHDVVSFVVLMKDDGLSSFLMNWMEDVGFRELVLKSPGPRSQAMPWGACHDAINICPGWRQSCTQPVCTAWYAIIFLT